MPITALVIGASRGLGLAIIQDLEARSENIHVIGTIRGESNATVRSLGIETIKLDITSDESIAAAAAQIHEIDILIINAAIGDKEKIISTSTERLSEYLTVNVIGTHRVLTAFLPALRRGKEKKILLISSQSGSMEKQVGATRGFSGPYSVAKAAVNMLAIQYHNELNVDANEGFTVVPVHPGWVATDMGKIAGDGGMEPAKSAKGLVDLALKLTPKDSASFFLWDGSKLPW